jgi:hypothetical protein
MLNIEAGNSQYLSIEGCYGQLLQYLLTSKENTFTMLKESQLSLPCKHSVLDTSKHLRQEITPKTCSPACPAVKLGDLDPEMIQKSSSIVVTFNDSRLAALGDGEKVGCTGARVRF